MLQFNENGEILICADGEIDNSRECHCLNCEQYQPHKPPLQVCINNAVANIPSYFTVNDALEATAGSSVHIITAEDVLDGFYHMYNRSVTIENIAENKKIAAPELIVYEDSNLTFVNFKVDRTRTSFHASGWININVYDCEYGVFVDPPYEYGNGFNRFSTAVRSSFSDIIYSEKENSPNTDNTYTLMITGAAHCCSFKNIRWESGLVSLGLLFSLIYHCLFDNIIFTLGRDETENAGALNAGNLYVKTIQNCTFVNLIFQDGGTAMNSDADYSMRGGSGGGIKMYNGTLPSAIYDCYFENIIFGNGGASRRLPAGLAGDMSTQGGDTQLYRCTLKNITCGDGGGVYGEEDTLYQAPTHGGGIFNTSVSTATIYDHCLMENITCGDGGEVYPGGSNQGGGFTYAGNIDDPLVSIVCQNYTTITDCTPGTGHGIGRDGITECTED